MVASVFTKVTKYKNYLGGGTSSPPPKFWSQMPSETVSEVEYLKIFLGRGGNPILPMYCVCCDHVSKGSPLDVTVHGKASYCAGTQSEI